MSRDGPVEPAPVVTLDGLSGCGKSTLARELATRLGWAYLDSGAWYRALAWAVLDAGGEARDARQVLDTLSRIDLHCHADGVVLVNGRPLRNELRSPRIDQAVADVADHPEVRAALTERMRRLRDHPGVAGVVADGRDAGAVIFPDARAKVFVQASLAERARRRHQQLAASGLPTELAELAEVQHALEQRDRRDLARGGSAPRPPPGSLILDNDHLTVEQALGRLLAWLGPRLPARPRIGAPRPAERSPGRPPQRG